MAHRGCDLQISVIITWLTDYEKNTMAGEPRFMHVRELVLAIIMTFFLCSVHMYL